MHEQDYEYEIRDAWLIPPPPPEDEEPRWTRRRVLLLIIAIITIVAFIGTYYMPGVFAWIQQRNSELEPTRTPLPRAYNDQQKIEVITDPDHIDYLLIF